MACLMSTRKTSGADRWKVSMSISSFVWWCDGDGAVELTTGGRFFPEWPYLNAEMFQLFINAFAPGLP